MADAHAGTVQLFALLACVPKSEKKNTLVFFICFRTAYLKILLNLLFDMHDF
jgi:hypothetical protein